MQVNNLHLIRGMLGRPGCGLLQMNGQPSAENTRECGADGDLPGFRNWQNDTHVEELARLWNVPPDRIPHFGPPTHALQIFRYAEQGSIRLLWISGTNPAVSLPELARIRSVLAQERLFTVVQDLFLTETAQLADVVLPAAAWGEKTGVLTNADRTVHLVEKAVEPPGEARSDLDIFLDYAARMDFRDQDGGPPRPPGTTPGPRSPPGRSAAPGGPATTPASPTNGCARAASSGRAPPDRPDGTPRLYGDGISFAHPDVCETYGKDLVTGAGVDVTEYRSLNPDGKAVLKAAEYLPPHEDVTPEHPLQLITGRTVYHFHTRTKTGRVPELNDAAPDVWAELSPEEAARQGLSDGDLIEVRTPRGAVRARLRTVAMRDGTVFLPFHYGYWDTPGGHRPEGDGAAGPPTRPPSPTGTPCPSSPCSRRARPASSSWHAATASRSAPPPPQGAGHDRDLRDPEGPARRRAGPGTGPARRRRPPPRRPRLPPCRRGRGPLVPRAHAAARRGGPRPWPRPERTRRPPGVRGTRLPA
ncbi:hypothetical protein GCM10020256_04900 [Streptomyces thermocoprophilus]